MTNEDEQPPDPIALDLPAAVASGWIAPSRFYAKTTRGRFRTEWDGDEFPVTTTKVNSGTEDEK